jgi:hypothetical protein
MRVKTIMTMTAMGFLMVSTGPIPQKLNFFMVGKDPPPYE